MRRHCFAAYRVITMRRRRFPFLSNFVNDVPDRIKVICFEISATFSLIDPTVRAGRVEDRAHSRDAR
jgi:hypothetical protein